MQIKTVILVLVLLTRSNVGLLQNSRANNVNANNVRIAHDIIFDLLHPFPDTPTKILSTTTQL